MATMDKLKKRWGIQSNTQVLLIIIVFAITGSSSAYLTSPILETLELTRAHFDENFWFGGLGHYTTRILLIFIVYQFLLIFIGWIFGQFNFFWNFEKKMLCRFGLGKLIKD